MRSRVELQRLVAAWARRHTYPEGEQRGIALAIEDHIVNDLYDNWSLALPMPRNKGDSIMPKFLTIKELNIIRGKTLVGAASREELLSVFGHLDAMEMKLDELDCEDALGTEGWRHTILEED